MNAPVTRSGIEEVRERIRRLEGAAAHRRLVLPFGIKEIDRLVKAITKRDVETARAAAIDHVKNSARSALGVAAADGTGAASEPPRKHQRRKENVT
jgi:hypothetical protein